MDYLYEQTRTGYEDLASGRVLFNAPGLTAFPVRLASEIYQRGKARLQSKGRRGGYTLYDPCCGGAYLLTTIGLLHGEELKAVIGSDIDAGAVEAAKRNLALLHPEGLDDRLGQLRKLADAYGKESHRQAVESARRLKARMAGRGSSLRTACFQADATGQGPDGGRFRDVDLAITDVPYGATTEWKSDAPDPVGRLLENLLPALAPCSVVAIVADKSQAIAHANYARLERFKVGKRQVVLLEPSLRA